MSEESNTIYTTENTRQTIKQEATIITSNSAKLKNYEVL